MPQITFSIRMEESLKKDLDVLCKELGMTASTAFNVFAKAMVRGMKFPFEIGLFTQEENQAQLLQNQLNQELYQELLLGRQLSHTQKIHRARLYSKLKNPKLSEEQELRRQRAIQAVKEIREAAAENGVADMTLDEINEEIRLARQERKEREKENKENVENNANNKE